ncbi:hypothetical protein [Armatimonas sp.]|uniref:hypothetical protein n=1 Tax=Armatimonas sp. TaxID=1872638 RepID=UPI00286CC3CE|nr:hypothetical protein [Armatimonas sp.]
MIGDADSIIEEFLDGAPRAETWSKLREALAFRLEAARREGDTAQIEQLEQQVAALAQEEAITRFVEDSVRVTLVRPRGGEFDFDDEF